jgi:hypothetical protein
MPNIEIVGIVAARNKEPYVEYTVDGNRVQLTPSEARKIAGDLVLGASRAEADAMVLRFFADRDLPEAAAAAFLIDFRDFRLGLDLNKPQEYYKDPKEEE